MRWSSGTRRGNTITIPRPDIVSMSGISAAEAGAMASNGTGGSGPTGNSLFPGFGPADGSGSGTGIVPAGGSGTPEQDQAAFPQAGA